MKIDNNLLKELLSSVAPEKLSDFEEQDVGEEEIVNLPNFSIASIINTVDEEVVFNGDDADDLNFISSTNRNQAPQVASEISGFDRSALSERLRRLSQIHLDSINASLSVGNQGTILEEGTPEPNESATAPVYDENAKTITFPNGETVTVQDPTEKNCKKNVSISENGDVTITGTMDSKIVGYGYNSNVVYNVQGVMTSRMFSESSGLHGTKLSETWNENGVKTSETFSDTLSDYKYSYTFNEDGSEKSLELVSGGVTTKLLKNENKIIVGDITLDLDYTKLPVNYDSLNRLETNYKDDEYKEIMSKKNMNEVNILNDINRYVAKLSDKDKQNKEILQNALDKLVNGGQSPINAKTTIEGTTITFANGMTMDYKKNGTLRPFTPKVNDDGSVTFTRTLGATEEVYVYNENGKKVQHNYERQYGLDENHSYNDDGKEIYTQRTNEKGVVIFERSSINGNPKEYSEVQHDYNGNLTISRITDSKEINTCLVNYAAKFIQFKVDGIMISLGAVDGITRDKEFTKDMLDKLVEYAQSLDIKHYPNVEQQKELKKKVKELLSETATSGDTQIEDEYKDRNPFA